MQSRRIFIIVHKKHLIMFFIILPLIYAIPFLIQLVYSNPETSETFKFLNNNDSFLTTSSNAKSPKLAIIIDDFGLDRNGVQEIMTLNRHLTFAVMPLLRYSKHDAATARTKGYEVIVHLPIGMVRPNSVVLFLINTTKA